MPNLIQRALTRLLPSRRAPARDDAFRPWQAAEPEAVDERLRRFLESGHREIEGRGGSEDALRVLAEIDGFHKAAGIGGNLLELGVDHGRTLVLLALLRRASERAFAVDSLEAADGDRDGGAGDRATIERHLDRFVGGRDRIEVIVADPMFLTDAQTGPMRPLRLVHVGGGRGKEAVLGDLDLAQGLLGPGGVIVVDGFLHSGHPGVAEACHAFFHPASRRKVAPFAIGLDRLMLVTVGHHRPLVEHLRGRIKPPAGRAVRLFGYEAVCLDPH
jgi:hypothetical protein